MLFIGFDPSLTGTGLVSYRPGNKSSKGCRSATVGNKNATKTLEARLRRYEGLLGEIHAWLPEESDKVSGAAIEGYSSGVKGNAAISLPEFGGIVRRHLILTLGYKVVEVPPGTLKLFVIGKGVGGKADVKLAAYKRWGVEFDNDNETDAYVLARIAACHFGVEKPENDAQRRALKKLAS